MGAAISVGGTQELIAALKAVTDKTRRRALRRGAKKALDPVLKKAIENVPVDSGLLLVSLRLQISVSRNRLTARVSASHRSATKKRGEIRAYHAHLVEYGHAPSGGYAKREGATDVPAYPFLRPAWDAVGDQRIADAFEQEVLAEAQKAFAGK